MHRTKVVLLQYERCDAVSPPHRIANVKRKHLGDRALGPYHQIHEHLAHFGKVF